MGSKHLGPDFEITLALQKESGIDTFIETGTYKGMSSAWAADHFPTVITIEGMPDRYWKTWYNTLGSVPNVMMLLGDSWEVLPKVLRFVQVPALFWLDAHYCTTNQQEASAGLQVCPVMHELLTINEHPCAHLHIIMVDDARLFGVEKGWPSEKVLLSELRKHNRRCVLKDDVWYGLPSGLDATL